MTYAFTALERYQSTIKKRSLLVERTFKSIEKSKLLLGKSHLVRMSNFLTEQKLLSILIIFRFM